MTPMIARSRNPISAGSSGFRAVLPPRFSDDLAAVQLLAGDWAVSLGVLPFFTMYFGAAHGVGGAPSRMWPGEKRRALQFPSGEED